MKRARSMAAVCLAATLASATLLAAPVGLPATELGRGSTLVLLHSMGAARASWMPTARKLIGSHRVVMADLPGHGRSPLPDPFSLEAAADVVGQLLAAQKAESTIVVGQGMGGVLALMALAAHPERARGLVLIDAALLSPMMPDQQREQMAQFIDANYDTFLRTTFTRMGRDSAQGVLIHAQAVQVPPSTVKAYFAKMLTMDVTRTLKAAHLPILVVGTERVWPPDKDSLTFVKTMGYAGASGLEVRRMANCGFLVASEQPDSLAALLDGFASKVLARR